MGVCRLGVMTLLCILRVAEPWRRTPVYITGKNYEGSAGIGVRAKSGKAQMKRRKVAGGPAGSEGAGQTPREQVLKTS